MPEIINLAGEIEKQISPDMVAFIKTAGRIAQRQQQRLYLVGGMVRDLLLGRHNFDIDLVVGGDAIALAEKLAEINDARVVRHKRFGTAKLRWNGSSVDVATARSETYERPGALPSVRPGTISDDLARRDFTINAMAVELNPRHFGELLDPFNGINDLEHGIVRVLHEKSFIDDATRIWRAIRYEQRLGFNLELATQELLRQSTVWLDTVGGNRVRRELELVLAEDYPEKVLCRADELGALNRLHHSLNGDTWLAETFTLAREPGLPVAAGTQLYLALLAYRLSPEETEQLLTYLKLPKRTAQVLRDTMAVKNSIGELSVHGLAPSHIYALLHGHDTTALAANSLATDNITVEEHIELYLNVLRTIHPSLTGEDIRKLGVRSGPKIRELSHMLLEARLDGSVRTRREEEAMVRERIGR